MKNNLKTYCKAHQKYILKLLKMIRPKNAVIIKDTVGKNGKNITRIR